MKERLKKIKGGGTKYYREIKEGGIPQIMEYYDQVINIAYRKQLSLSEKTESELLRKLIRSKLGPYLALLIVSRSALLLTIVLDQRAYLKKVFSKKPPPPIHEKEI